jgi:hypothetical protein
MSVTDKDSESYEEKDSEQNDQSTGAEEQETAAADSSLTSENNEQQEPINVEEVRSQVAYIQSMAENNPAIKDTDEYKRIMAALAATEEDSEEEEEQDEEEEENEENEDTADDSDDDSDLDDEDDPFGISKKTKAEPKFDLELPKEVLGFLKKKYSIDKPDKFFSSVDTWRKQAQESKASKEELDNIASDLQALPSDVKQAIDLWASGKDHRLAFESASNKIDYNSDFEKQDKKSIVSHYYGEKLKKLEAKLDDGVIDEEDFEERLEDMHDLTEKMFKADKKRFEEQRAKLQHQEKQAVASFNASVGRSVSNLREKYPSFSNAQIKSIEHMMANGDVDGLFYNKDGSYTDQAAEFIALAKFGDKYIKSVKEKSIRKGESKANLQIVENGKKTMVGKKSASRRTDPEAEKAVQHLTSTRRKDPYA